MVVWDVGNEGNQARNAENLILGGAVLICTPRVAHRVELWSLAGGERDGGGMRWAWQGPYTERKGWLR